MAKANLQEYLELCILLIRTNSQLFIGCLFWYIILQYAVPVLDVTSGKSDNVIWARIGKQ